MSSRLKFALALLPLAILGIVFAPRVHAETGSPWWVLPSTAFEPGLSHTLVVAGPGTQFNSPVSEQRFYVRRGADRSSTGTPSVMLYKSSGWLMLSVSAIDSSGNCSGSNFNYKTNITSGQTVSIPSGSTAAFSGIRGGTIVTYDVYCVFVRTTTADDVPFVLTTSNWADFLANTYNSENSGTGYMQDYAKNKLWGQKLVFGTPCTTAGFDPNRKIWLYDLDINHRWGGGVQAPIKVTLQKRPLYGGVLADVPLKGDINPFTGYVEAPGENSNFHVEPIEGFKTGYLYSLELSQTIQGINAIRIALPYDQIYSVFECAAPPTCSFNDLSAPMASGGVKDVDVTITNTNNAPLIFDPTDVRSSLGLINPSDSHATGGQYPPTPDNTTRWRPMSARSGTALDSFTDPSDGRSKQRIHPSSTVTLNIGQSYTFRVAVAAKDLVTGNLAPGNYTIGFRVLQRQYAPIWDAWMPYSSTCGETLRVYTNPPSLTPDCSFVSEVEEGEPYYPKIGFINSASSAEDAFVTVSVVLEGITKSYSGASVPKDGVQKIIGASGGPAPAVNYVISPDGGVVLPVGNRNISYTWSYHTASIPETPGATPCNVTVSVVRKPYFRVTGGDIRALRSSDTVQGWNKFGVTYTGTGAVNDNTGASGAGAQGMVISQQQVNGVASGVLLPLPNPKYLTLSNTGSGTAPETSVFGGGYSRLSTSVPSQATDVWSGATTSGAHSASGVAHYAAGNITIPTGTHMTVYVTDSALNTGTLYIDGDISYPNYTSVADIPHIRFVVSGDVRIAPNVTRIDAEIISTNGTIDTCYTTQANKWVDCASAGTLKVNGSLVGQKVRLNRLNGTLRSATAADGRFGGGAYTNAANIGEIIQFSPELYMSNPGGPSSAALKNGYDSITALPPLF